MKKLPAAKACTQTDICENQWCYDVYKEIKDLIADASVKSKYSVSYRFDVDFNDSAREKVKFVLRTQGYYVSSSTTGSCYVGWKNLHKHNSFRQYVIEQEGKQ